jgi:hypothetical protein
MDRGALGCLIRDWFLEFPAVSGKVVTGRFDGGGITSDSGLLLLSEADQKIGLVSALSGAIADKRQ